MAAITQADIEALQKAIVSGILTVEYAGPPARSITYQNTDAMLRALATMKRELANAAGTPVPSARLMTWRKGFRDDE